MCVGRLRLILSSLSCRWTTRPHAHIPLRECELVRGAATVHSAEFARVQSLLRGHCKVWRQGVTRHLQKPGLLSSLSSDLQLTGWEVSTCMVILNETLET